MKPSNVLSKRWRIATRGSRLALWQAHFVQQLLNDLGCQTEVKHYTTTGDRVQDRFLHEIGGKGLFIKELEQAMAADDADLAVHSLKDLPVKLPKGFHLASVLQRHSPADVLITRKDQQPAIELPAIITSPSQLAHVPIRSIATGSLRRRHLLQTIRRDWQITPIRGNIDTRLGKLKNKEFDAIILAKASLDRLAISDFHLSELCPNWFIPCAGQGALAIETLSTSNSLAGFLKSEIECSLTRRAIDVERGILAELGGDCTMPFGCYVHRDSNRNPSWTANCIVLGYSGQVIQSTLEFGDNVPVADVVMEMFTDLKQKGVEAVLHEIRTTTISN